MSASAEDADLIRGLERALSRFPKRVMITVETGDAPVAALQGEINVSRFDGGGADVLTIEMVPEWTLYLHAARVTSWRETKRPRTLSIQYAGVEIQIASIPLERFGDCA